MSVEMITQAIDDDSDISDNSLSHEYLHLFSERQEKQGKSLVQSKNGEESFQPAGFLEHDMTRDEVGGKYSVTTKSIDRWRAAGKLPAIKKLQKNNNRPQFIITQSDLNRFFLANPKIHTECVTEAQRQEIIQEVREIYKRTGELPIAMEKRIVKKTGKSKRAVTKVIKQWMQNELPSRKTDNFGEPAEQSAEERRVKKLLNTPIEYIPNTEFLAPDAAQKIIVTPPQNSEGQGEKASEDIDAYLALLYEHPLLTRAGEQHYFRLMNYLKFRARQNQDAQKTHQLSEQILRQIEADLQKAEEIKNLIIQRNLRIVIHCSRKFLSGSATNDIFELISDGNVSLIKAVEKFDYAQENKFSTYAWWAITYNFNRSRKEAYKRQKQWKTNSEVPLEKIGSGDADPSCIVEQAQHLKRLPEVLPQVFASLSSERDAKIIRYRYGLDETREPHTLEETGYYFGLTKERIRQIEEKILKKIRQSGILDQFK